jgi:RNA polymerase sigma-70 factor (ECF subfamily)
MGVATTVDSILRGAFSKASPFPEEASMPDDRSRSLKSEEVRLFESLMARHQDQLYRVAYRMTGNPDEAEDLVQEALTEAFQSFRRFQPGTHFDRWVCRIMSHTYIDRLRRKSRAREESLDQPLGGDAGEGYYRELPDDAPTPEARALSSEVDRRVQAALKELPEDFRMAVVLCDLEGYSYEEIAQFVRCPVGTVRSRIHRGRSMLAQKLRSYVEGSF